MASMLVGFHGLKTGRLYCPYQALKWMGCDVNIWPQNRWTLVSLSSSKTGGLSCPHLASKQVGCHVPILPQNRCAVNSLSALKTGWMSCPHEASKQVWGPNIASKHVGFHIHIWPKNRLAVMSTSGLKAVLLASKPMQIFSPLLQAVRKGQSLTDDLLGLRVVKPSHLLSLSPKPMGIRLLYKHIFFSLSFLKIFWHYWQP